MTKIPHGRIAFLMIALLATSVAPAQTFTVDPVTRYFHVVYDVPADAPEEVVVSASWSTATSEEWQPAKVMALRSETALRLLPNEEWVKGVDQGRVTERRAAGLKRTVVFNPYPEAQIEGQVDVRFRVELQTSDARVIATHEIRLQADNSDVVYVEDWSKIFQHQALAEVGEEAPEKWHWKTDQTPADGVSLGNALYGDAGTDTALPQLSYPLDLKGDYALFVNVPGAIKLRLTGDERKDRLSSRRKEEVLWRWTRMDRQNLVLCQPYRYTGYAPAAIDYVKLVPLTEDMVAALEAPFAGERDKSIAGYWEPYSYAFHDRVSESLWHREYLTAYPEARVDIVDMQIGRFGMKVVYESRLTDNLYYATRGDPIGKVEHPQTDNVGRMQQFSNTLQASVRHAEELGFQLHANFGASNCYPGSPLQGDFSKEHPEWMRGSTLRFEVPEVRAYALSLYRESLEIGAKGLSLDFCRYPETIDTPETCNLFLKELRALADEFGKARGARIPILVRFPAIGVRRAELFDYATWVREGWVDYLCPSNIQGRHHHFDIAPYLAVTQNSKTTLLPCVDGLGWGPTLPGPFLWRVNELYEAGAPGIYLYQADARVLGPPTDRRALRVLGSKQAVQRWWDEDARLRPERSKGIYITPPQRIDGYPKWHRLRVWLEGIPMGEVEFYLDDELICKKTVPPYLLGTEDYDSDTVIPKGKHTLRIRAKDGEGWLEQSFKIVGG